MAEAILNAVAGVSGYDALEALCYAFYRYAVQNPGSIDDSFDLSLKVLIAGIKELETN